MNYELLYKISPAQNFYMVQWVQCLKSTKHCTISVHKQIGKKDDRYIFSILFNFVYFVASSLQYVWTKNHC